MVTRVMEDVETKRGVPSRHRHSRKGRDKHSELTMFISDFAYSISVSFECVLSILAGVLHNV